MNSLIRSALVAASFVLLGNAAMAAGTQAHNNANPAAAHARAPVHVTVRSRYPAANTGHDYGEFMQSLFGGVGGGNGGAVVHYTTTTQPASVASSGSSSFDSPSYSTTDNSAQDAIDASNSAQATQEQNDAANAAFSAGIAAAEQTEINAN